MKLHKNHQCSFASGVVSWVILYIITESAINILRIHEAVNKFGHMQVDVVISNIQK